MKKETIPLCVIAITVLSLFFIVITTAGRPSRSDLVEHVHPSSIGYTKDVVLVRFKPEKLEARTDSTAIPDIAASAHAKVGATVVEEFKGVPGLQLVRLPEGVTVPDAVVTYRQNPNILYAEPNYIRHADVIPNDPILAPYGVSTTPPSK